VVRDGEITLHLTVVLSLKENRVLHFIVAEEALNVRPDGEGGQVRLVDEVEDTLGDGGVDPVGEGVINLPLRVAVVDGRHRVDLVDEAEFAENRVEEAPPLTVIGIKEVKMKRNMVPDVHLIENGKRTRLGRIEEIEDTRIRARGRVARRLHHHEGGAEVADAKEYRM
jgi:hypothetical protein